MTTPTPVTLVGATGLTGSAALSSLLQTKSRPFNITTIARKAINPVAAANPATTYSHNLISDLFDAPNSQVATKGGIYVSCLGTTRANAGSFAEQEKLDLGLNRDLAQRAKADGAETLILVSSAGTSSSSWAPYSKMKGQLEDLVKGMDFAHCIILRPGLLLGARNESRVPEHLTQVLFRGMGKIGLPMGSLCVDAEDVGACIAQLAANPPAEKITVVDNSTIIDLAKQWRQTNGA